MNFDDDDFYSVHSVDLQVADKGYKLCDKCEGQGTYMFHKCCPNGPVECEAYCDVCDGDGQVAIPVKASVSRNKREGWYAGKSLAKLMRLWGESKKPRRFRVPEKRLSLRLWHRDSP